MGILCRAANTECVKNFEVREIGVDDSEMDGVLKELKSTALCPAHRHSLSWGRQRG